MNIISQITTDPYQTQTLILPDGSSMTLTLVYIPLQYGWFITELTWGTFTVQGVRITVSPNILYQWKNVIPFGLACLPNAVNREPTQQQDFATSAFSLYLLTAAEVAEYTALLEGESSA